MASGRSSEVVPLRPGLSCPEHREWETGGVSGENVVLFPRQGSANPTPLEMRTGAVPRIVLAGIGAALVLAWIGVGSEGQGRASIHRMLGEAGLVEPLSDPELPEADSPQIR